MKSLKWLLILLVVLQATIGCNRDQKMETLVFIDSSDSLSSLTKTYLLPYLDHFGVAYEVADINTDKLTQQPSDYALVIIGHPMKLTESARKFVKQIQSKGAGVVSFDTGWFKGHTDTPTAVDSVRTLLFNTGHYITALHQKTDTVKCSHPMAVTNMVTEDMQPLVVADGKPLLLASKTLDERVVIYTSMDWMNTNYVGAMMGLDDCLWRSLVWAARKPFVMRGLPPLVTMRVDDVAGRGQLMQQSPLYWINTANKYGFKPWVSLFIYNLNPAAVNELRGYILNGQATASPHALGRPNRDKAGNLAAGASADNSIPQTNTRFYYSPDAIPLREKIYDEFIYFDHQHKVPFSDQEAERGLKAADEWWAKNQPLPMSKYFLAHWYEMGSNIIPHVAKNWGVEFLGINREINMPWADSIPWFKGGPFRLYEKPGTVTNKLELRGQKAVYYADFVDIAGYKFFNCLTEIRDNAEYEWSPNNQTEVSAQRGIVQLRRALSSMALSVLFTHECDYIYLITPQSWDDQLRLISEAIRDYHPMMMTMDDALKIVRAHKTSRLSQAVYQKGKENIDISLEGNTDTKTYVYVFTADKDSIRQQLVEIPQFSQSVKVPFSTKTAGSN